MSEYERYDEIYDSVLLKMLEESFKESYRKGWFITALVKMPDSEKPYDKWLVKWSRDILSNPIDGSAKPKTKDKER